jgi:signal transduction histidine kinase
MLLEFVTAHRDTIIRRAREKVVERPWPTASTDELTNGVPQFLTQLAETLKREATDTPFPESVIGSTAARHGRDLLGLGFSVSQVVHDYGDVCQAVTEVALEQDSPISTTEFHTLNRCLDTAIAEAVTEHARVTAQSRSDDEVERLGQLAHELRDVINTATFAFHALKRGTVAINGSTGAVLGRSLLTLRDLVSGSLVEVRMAANQQRRQRLTIRSFFDDVAASGALHAEYRGLRFTVEPVDPELAVDVDPELLSSAVTNLLNNAFKYTQAPGRVTLRAHQNGGHVRIEVEDQCGGIPDAMGDPFQPFGDRHGDDKTGLGLGLSIARKAVRAHDGNITVRNVPGRGCVFVIELPTAAEETRPGRALLNQ